MTAGSAKAAHRGVMSFRSAPAETPRTYGVDGDAPSLRGEDALMWARRIWDDRDVWLHARGGVESVFMAAQLIGCRDDAVRWLRQRTRLQ